MLRSETQDAANIKPSATMPLYAPHQRRRTFCAVHVKELPDDVELAVSKNSL
jgi:hypothetical protein